MSKVIMYIVGIVFAFGLIFSINMISATSASADHGGDHGVPITVDVIKPVSVGTIDDIGRDGTPGKSTTGGSVPLIISRVSPCFNFGENYEPNHLCRASFQSFLSLTELGNLTQLTCNILSDGRSAVSITRYYTFIPDAAGAGTYYLSGYICSYPTVASTQPIRRGQVVCYYNFNGSHYTSQNRAAIGSGGTWVGSRPTGQAAPTPSSGRSNYPPGNCNQTQNGLSYTANVTDYGYYRITASLNYKVYSQWGFPTWMNKPETWWMAGAQQSSSNTNYYTYSCSLGTNRVFDGPMSYGALPAQNTRQFDVSSCVETWKCVVGGNIQINGTGSAMEVMRNGDNIPVKYPSVEVVGAGARNANGTNTPVSDNNMQYKNNVSDGSSPFNGTNANASNQYFKQYKANGTTVEPFSTWQNNPNANRDKFMRYYWASDVGKSHQLNRDHRFVGQFLVPRSASLGGSVSMQWITDTADCPRAWSNNISVLRAVNY